MLNMRHLKKESTIRWCSDASNEGYPTLANLTQIGDKSLSCSQCEEKFAQETDLNTHKVIHTCDKPFSCSQCEEKFFQETDLKQHEAIHKSEGHSAVPNVTMDSERCKSCNQKQEDLTKKYKVTRNEVISKIRCEEIEAHNSPIYN